MTIQFIKKSDVQHKHNLIPFEYFKDSYNPQDYNFWIIKAWHNGKIHTNEEISYEHAKILYNYITGLYGVGIKSYTQKQIDLIWNRIEQKLQQLKDEHKLNMEKYGIEL